MCQQHQGLTLKKDRKLYQGGREKKIITPWGRKGETSMKRKKKLVRKKQSIEADLLERPLDPNVGGATWAYTKL